MRYNIEEMLYLIRQRIRIYSK